MCHSAANSFCSAASSLLKGTAISVLYFTHVRFYLLLLLLIGVSGCSLNGTERGVGKYGVRASPRVVEEGAPIPTGGGRAMIGAPYKVAGKTYVPKHEEGYSRVGKASWYGKNFRGRLTANGEVFDPHAPTAAHTTMPLPSYARVTNLVNQRSMIVRVNDRGPFHEDREIDVSEHVAKLLDFRHKGMTNVRVDYLGPAALDGRDALFLLASYSEKPVSSSPGSPSPENLAKVAAHAFIAPAPRIQQAQAETSLMKEPLLPSQVTEKSKGEEGSLVTLKTSLLPPSRPSATNAWAQLEEKDSRFLQVSPPFPSPTLLP